MARRWIQKAVKKPGRVRAYVRRLYGDKAFTEKGTIKMEYLQRALEEAKKSGNTSLVRAIVLAIRFKRM